MAKRGERRTDLEMLEYVYPEDFIAQKVIPTIIMPNRAGDLFWVGETAGGTATVNRANGTALADRVITDVTGAYSLDLVEDRASVPFRYSDEHGMDFADRAGGRSAKKTIIENYEVDTADLLLGNAVLDDVAANHNGSLIEAIDARRDDLRTILGETVLTFNWTGFRAVTRSTEVQDRLKYTGVINQEGVIVRGIRKEILAQIFDIDKIEIGQDAQWGVTAAYDARASLHRRPANNVLALEDILDDPYFAARLQMNPGEADSPFLQRSWDANTNKLHQYDVEAYSTLKVFNSAGQITFDNIV